LQLPTFSRLHFVKWVSACFCQVQFFHAFLAFQILHSNSVIIFHFIIFFLCL
jgi:hypothetical protein